MPPKKILLLADVALVGQRGRVQRDQRDVVTLAHQLVASELSRKQVPQYMPAAPAVS